MIKGYKRGRNEDRVKYKVPKPLAYFPDGPRSDRIHKYEYKPFVPLRIGYGKQQPPSTVVHSVLQRDKIPGQFIDLREENPFPRLYQGANLEDPRVWNRDNMGGYGRVDPQINENENENSSEEESLPPVRLPLRYSRPYYGAYSQKAKNYSTKNEYKDYSDLNEEEYMRRLQEEALAKIWNKNWGSDIYNTENEYKREINHTEVHNSPNKYKSLLNSVREDVPNSNLNTVEGELSIPNMRRMRRHSEGGRHHRLHKNGYNGHNGHKGHMVQQSDLLERVLTNQQILMANLSKVDHNSFSLRDKEPPINNSFHSHINQPELPQVIQYPPIHSFNNNNNNIDNNYIDSSGLIKRKKRTKAHVYQSSPLKHYKH